MKLELLDFKEIDDFPAASGIEFYNNNIYLVGNRAPGIMVLNKKWKESALINLSDGVAQKTAKDSASGLATMTLLWPDKKPCLLAIGSGLTEQHNKGLLLNLENNKPACFDLSVFYDRLKEAGITNLNIEGIALVYDYIILANRGNSAHPENQLIITGTNFWKKQKEAAIQIVPLDFGSIPPGLQISGLTYSDNHELLLLSAALENDSAAEDDGLSGRSTLCIIENIYRKIGREKKRMKINDFFDLPSVNERFKGYNIESVCIQSEKDYSMKLQLVAYNDDRNGSFLFKTQLWL